MTYSLEQNNGSITSNVVVMSKTTSNQTQYFGSVPGAVSKSEMEAKRPADVSKSRSDPATPHQRSYVKPGTQTSPSTAQPTREGSPRSQNSESSNTTPAPRRHGRGCRFEAGMARAKRRVPYSLGPERLENEPEASKRKLDFQEESRLTFEMEQLYARLVLNAESTERRNRFVQKLESILRSHWPEQSINVSVFGSTGNCLGTSDSDVDICITTDCKELEHVCSIAELLDRNGMERVVCVSNAKVPIVKVWDPELQVAGDMNVNNPIALENTQMIRSYTAIDERFRPLAMIIKYWAKKRILNDAALGGTLSSYTWICMVLNFLQTRNPPILPTLQQKSGLAPNILRGVNVAFDKNMEDYKNFGSHNKSSLGQLLFQFFRYYGHELDYEENVLSVRLGKVIPKSQKAWHLLQDNRLCVEEPFNLSRNLANTADDTSMRGIHLELRRAFRLVSEGKLDVCCEQYEAGPEERKHTEAFIHPIARTIIPQAPTQPAAQTHRNNKNTIRGGRNSTRVSNRRSSNSTGRNPTYLHDLPFQMTPQELQLQAQHQRHLLHDQLFQQYQYLQLQEQELRMQLYQQSLRQRGLGAGQISQLGTYANSASQDSPAVLSGSTPLRMAMSPTMFQNRFGAASPYLRNGTPVSGMMTNPASPLLGHAAPDRRRFTRRTSATSSSPAGSLRAHSQPARVLPFSGTFSQVRPANDATAELRDMPLDRRISIPYHPQMFVPGHMSQPASVSGSLYEAGRRPAEYMGYYVGHSQSQSQSPFLSAGSRSTAISPIPSHAGLAIQNGGLSPKLSSNASKLASATSSPSLQSANLDDNSELAASTELANGYHTASEQPDSPRIRPGPLIVDGSVYSPRRRRPTLKPIISKNDGYTFSASTSDDLGIDTPSSSDDQYQEHRKTSLAKRRSQNGPAKIANGISEHFQSLSLTPPKTSNNEIMNENHDPATDIKESIDVTSIHTPPSTASIDEADSFDAAEAETNGLSTRRRKTKAERAQPLEDDLFVPSIPLGPRTNYQNMTASSPAAIKLTDVSNEWQTQRKKKRPRKTIRSENDAVFLNSAGGELLPLDESLRKGG